MYAKDTGGGDFKNPEPGTYQAVCVRVVDLGTQNETWQGKPKQMPKCMLQWELSELMDDGRPFIVTKRYTLSLGEKANLRKDLEGWRGVKFTEEELQGFPLKNLLGKPCLISLVEGKKEGKVDVNTVAKMPKGMPPLNPHGELLYFSLSEYDGKVFEKLGDYWKNLIMDSPEYIALQSSPRARQQAPQAQAAGHHFDDMDDDIPF